MSTAIKHIEKILSSEFKMDNYVDLVREIFSTVKIIAPDIIKQEYSNFSSHVAGYAHVGNYETPDSEKIAVFAVELKQQTYVENSRSTQRSYAKKLIENGGCDAALIAFYTPNDPDKKWRLSFVVLDYEMKIENGKMKTEEKLTPAKRYSYLVGQNEPCHTAISRFGKFIRDNASQPILSEMEEAFSVEAVTKEFFDLYCEKFYQLVEYLESNDAFKGESERCGFSTEQFAKKLMGQIVFLYFLQKKGWLGVGVWTRKISEKEYKDIFYTTRFSAAQKEQIQKYLPVVYAPFEDGYRFKGLASLESIPDDVEENIANAMPGDRDWGSGSKTFLRTWFDWSAKHDGKFYDNYLEPLFYATLNKNRGELGYSTVLHCRVPFLSGGLFDPIDGYDWEHTNFDIPDEIFSNKKSENDLKADGILDIFDRYNFTMSEDEPMEREVAIDPEMLGKVFENLLDVKDRKSKGAFYTPREIVHYMCQESLVNYLATNIDISEDAIRNFILYGDFYKDSDTEKTLRVNESNGSYHMEFDINRELKISPEIFDPKTGVDRINEIDELLKNIRVADPAVGSGAFPLGMLNEIVRARQNCSAYMATKMSAYNTRLMYIHERSAHALKFETIRNCIYAADIEPSAVDIAQLRLWLALVIDDEINPDAQSPLDGHRNPLPLPNLECNILCGNSLIDEFEGFKLIPNSLMSSMHGENREYGWKENDVDVIISKLVDAQDKLFRCSDPGLKNEIKNDVQSIKNQLIHTELGMLPLDLRERYNNSQNMTSKPFILWQVDFAKVFREKGGFDIVIGNPPYIGFQKVPDKEYHKTHFNSANGKYDFYVLFIERGLQLLAPKGLLSYICPSYFYKRNYGKNIRKLLLDKTNIRYIADFSDYQIFESAQTYTCIFGAQSGKSQDEDVKILGESLTEADSYFVPQSEFKEPSWNLEKPENNTVLEKVLEKSTCKFGDITKSISQGIVTGFNDIYYVSRDVIENNDLEWDYFVQAYKGKDIKHGDILDSQMFLFYPYVVDEKGKTVPVSEKEIMENAPNTYRYLESHKSELLSREYFVKSSKKWYELWNPRKKEHFFNKKFVFAEIGMFNDFVLVDKCFYTDSACGAELLPKYIDYYDYMLKYLNSDVATYIYKKVSVPKANGYSIYKNAFLKELPIVLIDKGDINMYSSMSQDTFNIKIKEYLGLSLDEAELIQKSLESYKETK